MKFNFKQLNLGRNFGGIRFLAARSMIYMSVYSLVMVSAAATNQIQEWFPWFSFPMLLCLMVLLLTVAMLIEHFVVYRAEVSYTTNQAYIDENPSVRDLKQIKKDVAKIMEHLGIEDE